MNYRENEQEIDPEIRKANALIKLIMIAFDQWYKDEFLPEDAIREKYFFRVRMMDYVNKIAYMIIKARNLK